MTIEGDPDIGLLYIALAETVYSPVVDSGDLSAKSFVVTPNNYGGGIGSVAAWIRGDPNVFARHAASPTWQLYVGSTMHVWRYVQIRLEAVT